MRVSALRLGVVIGVVVAAMHAMWAAMVALEWAQPFLDFIFRLHFVTPPYHVEAFDLATAAVLVAVTGAIGVFAGVIFAIAWNAIHSGAQQPPAP